MALALVGEFVLPALATAAAVADEVFKFDELGHVAFDLHVAPVGLLPGFALADADLLGGDLFFAGDGGDHVPEEVEEAAGLWWEFIEAAA